MKRVVALLRVSTNSQDLERQRVDIQRVVAAHSLDVIRTEEVDGVSGRAVAHDPQFQAIFRDLKRADIAGVAISALDRLFRPDFYGDFAILDHFRSNRKLLFSAKEGVLDPASDAGFMMSLMGGAQAGMEWRELRRRTMQGKEVKRLLGCHVNGKQSLPRGIDFDKQSGKWSYVEPDRTRILQAYEMLFSGHSWREIARTVGGGWSDFGLRRTLMNPIWRGERTYDVKTKTSDCRREQPLTVRLDIEPLLTRERWESAQSLIAERHSRWQRRPRKESPFLAAGLIECSCGKPFYTRTDYRVHQHHLYYCSSRYPKGKGCGAVNVWQPVMDAAIERIVSECLLQPKLLLKILAPVNAKPARPEASRGEQELARLEARRKRLLDAMLDGLVSKQEYADHLRAMDAKRRELESLHAPRATAHDPRLLVQCLAKTLLRFSRLTLEQRRELLRQTVKSVQVKDGAITLVTLAGGFLEAAYTNSQSHSTLPCSHRCQAPK